MEPLSSTSNRLQVRGFLTVHSAPSALCHHIDWAIQAVLGTWIKPTWTAQYVMPGTFHTQIEFRDKQATAAKLASALGSWHYLNFEVIENGDNGGELFRFTPHLGIHRAAVDLTGAVLMSENQLTHILNTSFDEDAIRNKLALALGQPWDVELDRFRGASAPGASQLRAI